jgi:hypothetical protein
MVYDMIKFGRYEKVTHCLSFSSSLVAVSYCWSRYRFAASMDWMWATAVYQLMIPKGSWAISEPPNQVVGVLLWKEMMREVNGRKRENDGDGGEDEGQERNSHRSSKLLLLLL